MANSIHVGLRMSICPYCWDNINAYRCCRCWNGIEQMVVSVSCSSQSGLCYHILTPYIAKHPLCLDRMSVQNETVPMTSTLPWKMKIQYLLTLQVSRYCPMVLQGCNVPLFLSYSIVYASVCPVSQWIRLYTCLTFRWHGTLPTSEIWGRIIQRGKRFSGYLRPQISTRIIHGVALYAGRYGTLNVFGGNSRTVGIDRLSGGPKAQMLAHTQTW